MSFNQKSRQEFSNRRSVRMSKLGREFEQEVLKLLNRMVEDSKLASAVYNAPFSREDREGKDFTVGKLVNGEIVYRSFGVTISLLSYSKGKVLHHEVPQFCFPIGTNPSTIEKRVLALFSSCKQYTGP